MAPHRCGPLVRTIGANLVACRPVRTMSMSARTPGEISDAAPGPEPAAPAKGAALDHEVALTPSGPPGGWLQAAVDESGAPAAAAQPAAKVNGASISEPAGVPRLARTVMGRLAVKKNEYARWAAADASARKIGGPKDFVLATPEQGHDPHAVFNRLRWGGLFVYATPRAADAAAVARQYAEAGFAIEEGPAFVRRGLFGLPLPVPLLSTAVHYFVARKVQLLWPGEDTERFTYSVQL